MNLSLGIYRVSLIISIEKMRHSQIRLMNVLLGYLYACRFCIRQFLKKMYRQEFKYAFNEQSKICICEKVNQVNYNLLAMSGIFCMK